MKYVLCIDAHRGVVRERHMGADHIIQPSITVASTTTQPHIYLSKPNNL